MSEIHADGGSIAYIPDNLTIAQFVLDGQHPTRPSWSHAARPWLIEENTGREISSDELRARTHGLANAIAIRHGIGRGDVVCIFSPNHIDYVEAIWAVHKLGAIVSPANPTYTAEELTHQLQMTKARLIIVGLDTRSIALKAAHTCGIPQERIVLFDPLAGSPHDNVQDLVKFGLGQPPGFADLRLQPGEAKTQLALLSFSSGTTGKPKAVMISHYSIIANVIQLGEHLQLNDEDVPLERKIYRPGSVTLGILPLYHSFGMHMGLFGSMFLGSTVVVSEKFTLERMLRSIQRYRVTHLYLVPPQVVLLCKSPIVAKYDLSSVYLVMSAAAPLSSELEEQLGSILPECIIGQGYGMTETATAMTFLRRDGKCTPGSAGVLMPGIVARVVRQDGSLAELNELGELYVSGPSIALGYLDNPTATEETFDNGWVRTGDEVRINERKEVFVVDRIKELIKVRGYQVAPSELEGHLLDHPDIVDVCVVGIPDSFSGELPFAFAVISAAAKARLNRDANAIQAAKNAIIQHVSGRKAPYKRLAGVEFVDAIPKNPSGKLLRRVLRERAKVMLSQGLLPAAVRSKL